jgi:hypothetical protein
VRSYIARTVLAGRGRGNDDDDDDDDSDDDDDDAEMADPRTNPMLRQAYESECC